MEVGLVQQMVPQTTIARKQSEGKKYELCWQLKKTLNKT